MKLLRMLPSDTKFDFISKKIAFFILSAVLLIGSVGLFLTQGLNYGIDFKGGIMMEVRSNTGPADIAKFRSDLSGLGLGEISIQEFGEPEEVLIRIQRQDGDEGAQQRAVDAVKEVLKDTVEYRRTEFVGPKVSEELFTDGVLAVSFALGAILIYIWFRFEWQFGMGAVLALIHDVITTIGIFALLGMEFNLSTVAAVLTIAGYSINDTVVVYDRVRENLRKYKKMDLAELLNMSVNDTLSRTIMTSVTTLLALVALYTLGGEVIRGFSFAMIWGILIGTYSSICLAVPILSFFVLRRSDDEEETDSEIEKVEGEGQA